MKSKGNTIFWAVIACLLWSTAYAGIKIGLQYDSPLHFAGIRFIISGLIILPFTVRPSKYFRMVREHWKLVLSVIILQVILNYTLFYLGMDLVPGALGAIIVGSQPLVTALVAAIMHREEKLTLWKLITIVFGITGVIMISVGRQAFELGDLAELLGVVMILGANVATATSNVIVALRSRGMDPLVLTSVSFFTGGLIMYLMALPLEGVPQGPLPAEYWLVLIWLAIMASVAFSVWFRLLQRPGVKVSELNLWKFIIPVVGAVLSWILVPDEKPDWLTIMGMFIITFSLVIFFARNNKTVVIKTSKREK